MNVNARGNAHIHGFSTQTLVIVNAKENAHPHWFSTQTLVNVKIAIKNAKIQNSWIKEFASVNVDKNAHIHLLRIHIPASAIALLEDIAEVMNQS